MFSYSRSVVLQAQIAKVNQCEEKKPELRSDFSSQAANPATRSQWVSTQWCEPQICMCVEMVMEMILEELNKWKLQELHQVVKATVRATTADMRYCGCRCVCSHWLSNTWISVSWLISIWFDAACGRPTNSEGSFASVTCGPAEIWGCLCFLQVLTEPCVVGIFLFFFLTSAKHYICFGCRENTSSPPKTSTVDWIFHETTVRPSF